MFASENRMIYMATGSPESTPKTEVQKKAPKTTAEIEKHIAERQEILEKRKLERKEAGSEASKTLVALTPGEKFFSELEQSKNPQDMLNKLAENKLDSIKLRNFPADEITKLVRLFNNEQIKSFAKNIKPEGPLNAYYLEAPVIARLLETLNANAGERIANGKVLKSIIETIFVSPTRISELLTIIHYDETKFTDLMTLGDLDGAQFLQIITTNIGYFKAEAIAMFLEKEYIENLSNILDKLPFATQIDLIALPNEKLNFKNKEELVKNILTPLNLPKLFTQSPESFNKLQSRAPERLQVLIVNEVLNNLSALLNISPNATDALISFAETSGRSEKILGKIKENVTKNTAKLSSEAKIKLLIRYNKDSSLIAKIIANLNSGEKINILHTEDIDEKIRETIFSAFKRDEKLQTSLSGYRMEGHKIIFYFPEGEGKAERSFLIKEEKLSSIETAKSINEVKYLVYNQLLELITKDGSINSNKYNINNFREMNALLARAMVQYDAANKGIDGQTIDQKTNAELSKRILKTEKITANGNQPYEQIYKDLQKSWGKQGDAFTLEAFLEANEAQGTDQPAKDMKIVLPFISAIRPEYLPQEGAKIPVETLAQAKMESAEDANLKRIGTVDGQILYTDGNGTLYGPNAKIAQNREELLAKIKKDQGLQNTYENGMNALKKDTTEKIEAGISALQTQFGKQLILLASSTEIGKYEIKNAAKQLLGTIQFDLKKSNQNESWFTIDSPGFKSKEAIKFDENSIDIIGKNLEVNLDNAKKTLATNGIDELNLTSINKGQLERLYNRAKDMTAAFDRETNSPDTTAKLKMAAAEIHNEFPDITFRFHPNTEKPEIYLQYENGQFTETKTAAGQTIINDPLLGIADIQEQLLKDSDPQKLNRFNQVTGYREHLKEIKEKTYTLDPKFKESGFGKEEIAGLQSWPKFRGHEEVERIMSAPPFNLQGFEGVNKAAEIITKGYDHEVSLADIFSDMNGFPTLADRNAIQPNTLLYSLNDVETLLQKDPAPLNEQERKNVDIIFNKIIVPCVDLLHAMENLKFQNTEEKSLQEVNFSEVAENFRPLGQFEGEAYYLSYGGGYYSAAGKKMEGKDADKLKNHFGKDQVKKQAEEMKKAMDKRMDEITVELSQALPKEIVIKYTENGNIICTTKDKPQFRVEFYKEKSSPQNIRFRLIDTFNPERSSAEMEWDKIGKQMVTATIKDSEKIATPTDMEGVKIEGPKEVTKLQRLALGITKTLIDNNFKFAENAAEFISKLQKQSDNLRRSFCEKTTATGSFDTNAKITFNLPDSMETISWSYKGDLLKNGFQNANESAQNFLKRILQIYKKKMGEGEAYQNFEAESYKTNVEQKNAESQNFGNDIYRLRAIHNIEQNFSLNKIDTAKWHTLKGSAKVEALMMRPPFSLSREQVGSKATNLFDKAGASMNFDDVFNHLEGLRTSLRGKLPAAVIEDGHSFSTEFQRILKLPESQRNAAEQKAFQTMVDEVILPVMQLIEAFIEVSAEGGAEDQKDVLSPYKAKFGKLFEYQSGIRTTGHTLDSMSQIDGNFHLSENDRFNPDAALLIFLNTPENYEIKAGKKELNEEALIKNINKQMERGFLTEAGKMLIDHGKVKFKKEQISKLEDIQNLSPEAISAFQLGFMNQLKENTQTQKADVLKELTADATPASRAILEKLAESDKVSAQDLKAIKEKLMLVGGIAISQDGRVNSLGVGLANIEINDHLKLNIGLGIDPQTVKPGAGVSLNIKLGEISTSDREKWIFNTTIAATTVGAGADFAATYQNTEAGVSTTLGAGAGVDLAKVTSVIPFVEAHIGAEWEPGADKKEAAEKTGQIDKLGTWQEWAKLSKEEKTTRLKNAPQITKKLDNLLEKNKKQISQLSESEKQQLYVDILDHYFEQYKEQAAAMLKMPLFVPTGITVGTGILTPLKEGGIGVFVGVKINIGSAVVFIPDVAEKNLDRLSQMQTENKTNKWFSGEATEFQFTEPGPDLYYKAGSGLGLGIRTEFMHQNLSHLATDLTALNGHLKKVEMEVTQSEKNQPYELKIYNTEDKDTEILVDPALQNMSIVVDSANNKLNIAGDLTDLIITRERFTFPAPITEGQANIRDVITIKQANSLRSNNNRNWIQENSPSSILKLMGSNKYLVEKGLGSVALGNIYEQLNAAIAEKTAEKGTPLSVTDIENMVNEREKSLSGLAKESFEAQEGLTANMRQSLDQLRSNKEFAKIIDQPEKIAALVKKTLNTTNDKQINEGINYLLNKWFVDLYGKVANPELQNLRFIEAGDKSYQIPENTRLSNKKVVGQNTLYITTARNIIIIDQSGKLVYNNLQKNWTERSDIPGELKNEVEKMIATENKEIITKNRTILQALQAHMRSNKFAYKKNFDALKARLHITTDTQKLVDYLFDKTYSPIIDLLNDTNPPHNFLTIGTSEIAQNSILVSASRTGGVGGIKTQPELAREIYRNMDKDEKLANTFGFLQNSVHEFNTNSSNPIEADIAKLMLETASPLGSATVEMFKSPMTIELLANPAFTMAFTAQENKEISTAINEINEGKSISASKETITKLQKYLKQIREHQINGQPLIIRNSITNHTIFFKQLSPNIKAGAYTKCGNMTFSIENHAILAAIPGIFTDISQINQYISTEGATWNLPIGLGLLIGGTVQRNREAPKSPKAPKEPTAGSNESSSNH